MKKHILIVLAAATALAAGANGISPAEALARATSAQKAPARIAKESPRLVHTAMMADGSRAAAYVFNSPAGGYMVLSADDSAPAVLGYSDKGSVDAANIPPAMEAWLAGYARQIEYAAAHSLQAAPRRAADKADVLPLVTTTWNQDAPYWAWCPVQSNKKCYTGCVATAMAQIVNWHRFPEKPTGGVKKYTPLYLGQTLTMDMDTVRFDYDKMLPRYDRNSPVENVEAVAALMQACGYISEMVYGNTGSGAMSWKAAQGLADYFGYDRSLVLTERDWYGEQEWADMVYDELTTNGPVYYDGSGDGGGHAFVCDGYSAADGFFHFNWGWDGLSDGYYRLDGLYPLSQGAGGVSEGYTWDQGIFRNFKPAAEGSDFTVQIAAYGGVRVPQATATQGGFFTMLGDDTNDGFCNYSLRDIEGFSFGAELVDKATGEATYIKAAAGYYACSTMPFTFQAYAKKNGIRINLPASIPDGSYTLRPVYSIGDGGVWHHMLGNQSFTLSYTMDVEGNNITFTADKGEAQPFATVDRMPEFFTTSDTFTVPLTFTNNGTKDFSGLIGCFFLTQNGDNVSVIGKGRSYYVSVPVGETVHVEYTSAETSGKLVDGDYGFVVGNASTGAVISEMYPAFVGNRFGALRLSFYNFNITDRSFLDANNVHASASITCPQGMYHGPIAMLISSSKKPFNPEFVVESEDYDFTAVETKDIVINGKFKGSEAGKTYYTTLGYRNEDGSYTALGDNYIALTVAEGCEADPVLDANVRVDRLDVPRHVDPANGFTLNVDVTNLSAATVGSADLEYAFGDAAPTKVRFDGLFIAEGESAVLSVKDVVPDVLGNVSLSVRVTALNDLADTDPTDNSASAWMLCLSPEDGFKRNIVVEEATDASLGSAPAGIVAMDILTRRYPEEFMGISVHSSDEMAAPVYSDFLAGLLGGEPKAIINRSTVSDAAGLRRAVIAELTVPALAEVNITNATVEGKEINVDASVRFAMAETNADYGIAYVVTENGVGPYHQQNDITDGSLDGWEYGHSPASILFDNVARNFKTLDGSKGDVPASIKPLDTYTFSTTVEAPKVEDWNKAKLVVMLVNQTTGQIENATGISCASIMGIASAEKADGFSLDGGMLTVAEGSRADVYTTSGIRLATLRGGQASTLARGLYIIVVDGNARKLVVK